MPQYNAEFRTHEGRRDFLSALDSLSPGSAIALVADKAWDQDYDWMHSALDSNFLRNTFDQSGACPFNEKANARFSAFAAVLCGGVYHKHVGDDAGPYATSLINEEKFGEVMEILVDKLSVVAQDRTTQSSELQGTCTVLMCCAVAIGRIDLMQDIHHLCPGSSNHHFVKRELLGVGQYCVTEVTPPAFAVLYSKPEALAWLCENGWMQKGHVASRVGAGGKVLSLVEFTREVAENPEMLPAVLEVIKNSKDTWAVADENAIFQIAHHFLENGTDHGNGISLSGRYFSALSQAGVFSIEGKTSELIRAAVEGGCVMELRFLQPYLDASAIFDKEVQRTFLHAIAGDNTLSTQKSLAMFDLFLPSFGDVQASDSECTVKKIDIRDANGNTALAYALIAGQTHLVQLLLEAGADHALGDNYNDVGLAELRATNNACSESINVLLAWRARDAMQKVLASTMQTRTASGRALVSQ